MNMNEALNTKLVKEAMTILTNTVMIVFNLNNKVPTFLTYILRL